VDVLLPLAPILLQLGGGGGMKRHQAGLVELGVADLQVRRIVIEMNLCQRQPQRFSDP